MKRPLEWSCITDVNSRWGPHYDNHGKEIPWVRVIQGQGQVLIITPYTEEEDDIDARLATLDRKLMVHSFRNLTLESLEGEDKRMEGNESEYLP